MPSFTKIGQRYFVTYITGPSHVRLGLSFSEMAVEPAMIQLPATGTCYHGEIDTQKIRDAVLTGVSQTCREMAVTFHPMEILYYANDSPRYVLYTSCAELLIRRLATNGEFTENNTIDVT